jgi:hypothetical protein
MIWATLGDIRFELLRAPESADLAIGHPYAEHAVIEGKPKLQWTGDALPRPQLDHPAAPFVLRPGHRDDGASDRRRKPSGPAAVARHRTYLGRYVIVDISEQTLFTGPTGRTLELAATLKLKEWAGGESRGTGEAVVTSGRTLIGSVWR